MICGIQRERSLSRRPGIQSAVSRLSEMRQITATTLCPYPNYPNGIWVVSFDDRSRIVVDISSARHSSESTPSLIKSAAFAYSASHPQGVLATVIINLSGQRLNSARKR
jgi:hypothetical protein